MSRPAPRRGHGETRRPPIARATLAALSALTATIALPLVAGAAPAGAATTRSAAHRPRVSFVQVQQQFMCVLCHEPLNEARSDEAYTENAYLRQLISAGDGLPRIKREMVSAYGPGVLAVPPAHGFSLLVFVIPGVVIVLGLIVLAYTIPRWRRRAARQAARDDPADPARAGPRISDDDARRLDADLARQP